jgi:hypothetical protein
LAVGYGSGARPGRCVVVSASASMSVAGRCRQLGEEPCASARIRCFIVGGSDRSYAAFQMAAIAGVGAHTVALRSFVASCTGVAAVAVVVSPSAAKSARKAVTIVVHSFMGLFPVMTPQFGLGDLRTFLMMCMWGRERWTDARGTWMFR